MKRKKTGQKDENSDTILKILCLDPIVKFLSQLLSKKEQLINKTTRNENKSFKAREQTPFLNIARNSTYLP